MRTTCFGSFGQGGRMETIHFIDKKIVGFVTNGANPFLSDFLKVNQSLNISSAQKVDYMR